MKKVLYITNIEVPYRVRFFNELAKHCELTVLYEKCTVEDRNETWAKSATTLHNRIFLRREGMLFTGICKELRREYDAIIVGCYNSPVQILAMLYMCLRRIPFILNLDGEPFLTNKTVKTLLKKFFISAAETILVAGEKAAESVRQIVTNKQVIPYYFSSLDQNELQERRRKAIYCERNKTILVVAQYLSVKGLDIVLEAAMKDQTLQYKFVGMGKRTEQFLQENSIPSNVEIIPFLQKEDLEREYHSCAMLVLPSRQECWGLVINEAASFGMPIVSTWGSGAAVEFLADEYSQYLAQPGDAESLYKSIQECRKSTRLNEYGEYLIYKSQDYSIEKSVHAHIGTLI